jgi:hypothetical protein
MDPLTVTLQAGALRIRFQKRFDRFTHVLEWVDADRVIPMMESVIGDSKDAWPIDVPLQEVVLESIGKDQRAVALGVGKSGYGHWSIAVEPLEVTPALVRWDIACRVERTPERLLSSLRWLGGTQEECVASGDPNRWEASCPTPNGKPLTLSIAVEIGHLHWDPKQHIVSVIPAVAMERKGTYRWCYTVCLS